MYVVNDIKLYRKWQKYSFQRASNSRLKASKMTNAFWGVIPYTGKRASTIQMSNFRRILKKRWRNHANDDANHNGVISFMK